MESDLEYFLQNGIIRFNNHGAKTENQTMRKASRLSLDGRTERTAATKGFSTKPRPENETAWRKGEAVKVRERELYKK